MKLAVQLLDPLPTIAPTARAVTAAPTPPGRAEQAEDEEEEQKREEQSEETETESPVRIAVVSDRRGAGGKAGGAFIA